MTLSLATINVNGLRDKMKRDLVFNLTLRYLYCVAKYSNNVLLNLTLKLCCSTKFYRIVS